MFAVRVRASLKPFLHGIYIRNCKISAISKCNLQDRFSNGKQILNSLRLSGNGVGIKLFHSTRQCYISQSDVELGSVAKHVDRNVIVKILTEKPVEKPELSQKTKSKKKKKKKKDEQVSDSVSKPKLLTEKPELSWKLNGERKTKAHASSSSREVTDSNVSLSKPTMPSSPTQDHKSKSQTSPSSASKTETSSKYPSSVVVIRIGNQNMKTIDSIIQSLCLSIGPLERLTKVNEDTVEVLFRVPEDATNEWTVEIVPEAEEEEEEEEEEESCKDRHQMGMRISSCYEELDKYLEMKRIVGKDFEVLLHSVNHLENHPFAPDKG